MRRVVWLLSQTACGPQLSCFFFFFKQLTVRRDLFVAAELVLPTLGRIHRVSVSIHGFGTCALGDWSSRSSGRAVARDTVPLSSLNENRTCEEGKRSCWADVVYAIQVTPFEVAFLMTSLDPLFFINRLVDLSFLVVGT